MRNQWRAGVSGYYGLDMNVFDTFCKRLGVPEEDMDDTFHCLLVMEAAALRFFESKRAQKP